MVATEVIRRSEKLKAEHTNAYVKICAASELQKEQCNIYFQKERACPNEHTLEQYCGIYYQLAFLTPGIRPAEAISRNWIRLMPN